jgi:hypothetical protein
VSLFDKPDGGARGPTPRPIAVTVTRAELERLLAEHHAELLAQVELALAAMANELRVELSGAEADLHRRIDAVHQRALRALTERISGGA